MALVALFVLSLIAFWLLRSFTFISIEEQQKTNSADANQEEDKDDQSQSTSSCTIATVYTSRGIPSQSVTTKSAVQRLAVVGQ